MSFTGSLSRRPEGHRPRAEILPRLLAVLRAPILDADLAAGVRPSASAAHRRRAGHLLRTRVRRRIADALNRVVEDVRHPALHGAPQAPIRREAIRRCEPELLALATSVATADNPRAQGVAIAFRLAFDGAGPLFSRPDDPNGTERLANTIQAARSALRVSADFE